MALIKSISGIRGTIGGRAGDNLSPVDIVKFSAAFAQLVKLNHPGVHPVMIIGRDARVSGPLLCSLVSSTLSSMGIDVIDLGLSTTPTVELAVVDYGALGGIILTASHNPAEWNALKLLNDKGEFLSAEDGEHVLRLSESLDFQFSAYDSIGKVLEAGDFIAEHIKAVCQFPLVDIKAITEAGFRVVVDPVNSCGAIAIPQLLKALGVVDVECINCEPTGLFAHNPEPLPENLGQIAAAVRGSRADLGIVVDPDVDRLAFICEDGEAFGEEYTLVAVADYVLRHRTGPVVSNLSSSRALKDVASGFGQTYFASAVGEVNVVARMKEVGAVLGGEGNGGIIVPDFHYGRDALIGVALFLSHLAKEKVTVSELRGRYPSYFITKSKLVLDGSIDVDALLARFATAHSKQNINTIDGVKIDLEDHWVHIRKSNTEPIIRIYVEAETPESAAGYAKEWELKLRNYI